MILQRKIIKESILEYCNKNNKELLKEWDFSRNIKEPKDYGKSSGKKVYWICEKGHSWEARIADRVRGNGCPYCAGQIIITGKNDLKTLYPRIAEDWDYELNYPFLNRQSFIMLNNFCQP